MKKTVFIVRHGETDLNRKGIVQGSGVNAPLNELGLKQAKAFYDFYKDMPFEAVLTSKLQRTHQTVQPFLDKGLPWEQFEDINEMNWGEHEGKVSTPEMHLQYQEIKAAWGNGVLDARLPGGESAAELGFRINRFVDHLKYRSERLLLVCSHGRAMSALVCLLHGLPLHDMNHYFHYNTGLWKVHFDGFGFEFELENDTKHLEAIMKEEL